MTDSSSERKIPPSMADRESAADSRTDILTSYNIVFVLQAIMNYFWFKRDLQSAITMPRVHDQLFPSSVFAETKFPKEVVKGLEAIGHKVCNYCKFLHCKATKTKAVKLLPFFDLVLKKSGNDRGQQTKSLHPHQA